MYIENTLASRHALSRLNNAKSLSLSLSTHTDLVTGNSTFNQQKFSMVISFVNWLRWNIRQCLCRKSTTWSISWHKRRHFSSVNNQAAFCFSWMSLHVSQNLFRSFFFAFFRPLPLFCITSFVAHFIILLSHGIVAGWLFRKGINLICQEWDVNSEIGSEFFSKMLLDWFFVYNS